MAQFKIGDKVKSRNQFSEECKEGTVLKRTRKNFKTIYWVERVDLQPCWFFEDELALIESNKTADEMLAELGWVKELENEVAAKYVKGKMSILIHKGNEYVRKEIGELDCGINYPEWKAIHKKLEELGWL